MDIWKLFVIALMPNLKVLLITVLGTFLAINRLDILTETARKNMNTMVYFVFSPALACSSLAKTITLRSMITLWFMPLSILLTIIIGTALGWLLVKIARVPRHLRGLVLGCCAVETDPENHSKCSTQTLVTTEDRYHTKNCVNQLEIEIVVPNGQEKKEKLMQCPQTLAIWSNLKLLFPPTLIGAIVGLIIGIVPQFRKLLVGESAPLLVIQDSLIMIGDACLPAMTMLVGANLLEGLKGQGAQLPLIVGIIIVRNIVLPAIGVGIVKGAVHFGLIHHDPLYEFVLLLQFALPPAVAISTSTQLFGNGRGECSIIMLATYSCAAVSLTLWCTFFIWLVL
ncbi:protein PIN-LIKES 1 isoform X5 [Glycine max]|uniref:protein PIN-LIKES 1 isoform X5 n=1 Tax=Glycine max TaxID=3847 RepID=UPI0007190955|nr:protein PIN-LIKES 1 isoform X5 [Glycine max]|eukprot:XP_014633421.1 protein PIN-LIKES 1 isoform X6 [Glycine max]